ncbi:MULTISPECIES: PTS system mannose/fructose/N-acetylgalactosamine-transporter subunit IIB [Enterocloster]|uniref:PTS system mannose/fructose/N-acetylgalactosamine-transporter subunit IIB n=1 Tax=Enterocloster TaxID=2719313 RepID=UPI001D065743|nr:MULTISPECIES: PTS sugar transporter subunit IIB [Enterocloster]MCB6342660.1 PTS sugar transporter subunit IIB [Enterocloster lavalensis]
MKIVMCRVDERLVHGQVIASWSKILSIRQILVIDDQLAKDSFMGTVLAMAAPSGVKVELVSVDEAVRRIQKDGTQDGVNTMLLFKGPQCALALVEKGVEIRELNIGNMGAGPSRKAISRNVYASASEVEIFKKLLDMGIDVYLQMVQQESRVSIATKL